MTEFLMVLAIAPFASFLTWLGVLIAERSDVSQRIVSAARLSSRPASSLRWSFQPDAAAVRGGPYGWIVLAFFHRRCALRAAGIRVVARVFPASRRWERTVHPRSACISGAGDLLIDGVVIGIGSTLTLTTGLLLALGLAISTAPLAL